MIDDHGGVANVRVDDLPLLVVDRPARPSRQRQLGDHLEAADVDHRGRAVLAERFAEVEAVQAPRGAVVGEAVRVRADRYPAEELLVRAPKDADAGATPVRREQEIVRRIDQDAGDPGEVRQRPQVPLVGAVDDVDPIRAGVGDVDAALRRVDVCVVEARTPAGRQRDEPDRFERHQPTLPLSTSWRHQA